MAADKPRPLLQNSLPGDANLRFLKDRSDLQKAPRSLRLSHAFWVAIDLPQYFVLGVTNKSTHWIRWDSFLYPIFRSRVWFWMGFPWIPWIFQLWNPFRVFFDRLWLQTKYRGFELGHTRFGGLEMGHGWTQPSHSKPDHPQGGQGGRHLRASGFRISRLWTLIEFKIIY